MKVYITFKTPDALEDAARDAAARVNESATADDRVDDEEAQQAADDAFDKVMEVGQKFIKYGEYLTVELDTETGTCTVKPV